MLVRLLNPLPLYHVFVNWKSLFLLGCMCLLDIAKLSPVTCTVGNVQLLASLLCLHCELNDLKNGGLNGGKWGGGTIERRDIQERI